MRKIVLSRLLVVLAFIVSGCKTSMPYDTKGAKPALIPVADLVNVVSQAIKDTQVTIAKTPALPPLEAVTLTLQTVRSDTSGGTIKVIVAGGGRTAEQGRTEALTVKLTPPEPDAAGSVSGSDVIYTALKDAILKVARAAGDAEGGTLGVLQMSSIGTELAFTLKTTTDGNVGFTIEPLDISAKRSIADQAVHKIAVSFARKK